MKKLESLSEYRARTAGFIYGSLPQSLETNPSLPLKVGPDGKMEPFMGNTVVFPLPEETKRKIARIQERLYQTCAPVLAEPLEPSSFHITLHDLLSGRPSRELRDRVEGMRRAALACLRWITGTRETVRLHTTALFNMVNSSMVLGFEPDDEESCKRLMACYEALQEVVPLNYPLTLHVTVAYFRPGTIGPEWTERLREVVDEAAGQEKIRVELPVESIEYQVFSDMNHYRKEQTDRIAYTGAMPGNPAPAGAEE